MPDFVQILTKYWGYIHFRPLQEEIIHSVYEGKDTLGLMPTGGGKSLTFQVPTLAMEGICLVITPLIALMKDQVENLNKRGIRAVAIHSGLSRNEIDIAIDNCIYGDFKFMYLSPERLTTDLFRARVGKMNVSLVTIDESHCISQWGYDFRPSYLRIAELRDYLPEVPFLALTATATGKVVDDIMEKLKFREKHVLQKSFERKNLIYRVDHVEDKFGKLIRILKNNPGSGIIYARNRKKTREIAMMLKKNDFPADYYHAGLSHEMRDAKQQEWQQGKTKVICATNAFGMGIDKADVRFVIHVDLPDSPESYFQEAGRAGRDEKKALAILLYNDSDRRRAEDRIKSSFPEIRMIKEVYHALGNFFQLPIGAGKGQSFDFNFSDFLSTYRYNALVAHNVLQILQKEGYIEITDEINNPSRVHFKVSRDDLYKFQVSNARFDGFIKLLLRSYSGFFSSYVSIDEQLLAKRSGLKLEEIYVYLQKLQKFGIIDYIPKRKNPVVVFAEERLDKKNLYFSAESYAFLKERFTERIQAMIHYASSITVCRSKLLLSYFGEKDSARCGQCDVCQERNELEMSNYEFDLINKEIRNILSEEKITLLELGNRIQYPEGKFLKVFRYLIDHNKVLRDEDQLLCWNE